MEQKKTPFMTVTVTCPICMSQFQSYKIKGGLYAVLDKESDQRPKSFKWTDPEFSQLNPLHYAMWRCTTCFYTDFSENFERRTDSKMLALKKTYKPGEAVKMPFMSEILRYTDLSIPSFETAVNLYLTSAYINEMPVRVEDKSYFKLARIYLRIAWLYREKYGSVDSASESVKLKQIFKNLDEIDANYSKLEASVTKLLANIKNRLTELYGGEAPMNNPYYANIATFLSSMKNITAGIGRVKTTAVLDQQGKLLGDKGGSENKPYYNFPSYVDFLMSLMSNWPDLPLSEKAALSLAVKNYTLSYTNEDFFDTPEKRLNAVDLIEDLYVRLDDYDSALNYITEIYRSGTKDRQGLYNKMNSKKADGTYPTQAEKDRMESQIARINSTLSKTSDKKKDLEEKRIAAALPKITAIIGQNPQITEAELIVRIGEIGVSESVYGDLKEKNLIPVLSGPDTDIKDNGAAEKEEHSIV
ncbi:MAG: hypothetical protein ACD_59C00108G0002 [uncultured bacterium]|uniref:DUF2225 domain-containing protein n=1 Tax=Candidatus Wallbacteria bacterium GWC2_49_35 TaxID=1817813 RepID=A0A1F7WG53_9BACT|nr:MAG: hypothetical protein ACD_59C00108G0002 [uncultured bacterium]OGM01826.1 MAG: hypothetical protein A2008_05905 [Candidatus Wallbacteria bacterium GWC2_49_35]HBC76281.1 hypothetical protein [Candidatus Wallbacteria bacterium]